VAAGGAGRSAAIAGWSYPGRVNYVVCPIDQARLKADLSQGRPPAGRPLLLACPECGRRYVLGDGGALTEVPAGDGGS
jgi:hypothetical protein